MTPCFLEGGGWARQFDLLDWRGQLLLETLSRRRGHRSWNEILLRKFELLSGLANICNGLETFLHDDCNAVDAIREHDSIPFGYDRRRLSVEWAMGEHGGWTKDDSEPEAN
ncbi:hypothetical protein SADUNF_Sadunf14G0073100 [Salix dunnii]|uniref:Uncharacterized protein n=1 Tax=Salix dunnii TaxID=1413687 RepID=A0A835JF65_9ROSI|nr:hypothetical protein SADUNF_Sadunf14G0073100 [Salix dunnii]